VYTVPEFALYAFDRPKMEAFKGRSLDDPLGVWSLKEQPFAYLTSQRFHRRVGPHLTQDCAVIHQLNSVEEVFCLVDDQPKVKCICQRRPTPKLSDAEVLTREIVLSLDN
jgi:hypothetical protein